MLVVSSRRVNTVATLQGVSPIVKVITEVNMSDNRNVTISHLELPNE
jgi:hypothetical protein